MSKVKIALLFAGATAFVAAGLWMWANPYQTPRLNSLYVKAVASASVGFFGLCAVYALFKLFDTAPGLIVDAEGIIDNSSGVSAGRIPWSDISGFKISTIQKQRFLTIEVYDAEKYVRRANVLKRPLVALNAKYFGSPIQISANTLKTDFDELIQLVTSSYARYRSGHLSGPENEFGVRPRN